MNGSQGFRTENGSSQGQNLALTGLFVPVLLNSGHGLAVHDVCPHLHHPQLPGKGNNVNGFTGVFTEVEAEILP